MAGIGRKDTRPEMTVRRLLHKSGIRYVLHDRRLPGTPDIVMPRFRVCVLVHGCYWHRHAGCKYATTPTTRPDFWLAKFQANVARDRRDVDALLKQGWRVIVLWECGIRGSNAEKRLDWLPAEVQMGDLPFIEWPSYAFAGTDTWANA
jgi:DNA mismatch endonuclease (patch repair protein)